MSEQVQPPADYAQATTIRPKREKLTRLEHLRLARRNFRLAFEHLWSAIKGR